MAIPKECKRLAEVDFPIAEVSRHSAREKSIRHGHPSTLHLWWARRPLAACRSMLLALLLPDPCDKHCPEEFKDKARELLSKVQGKPGPEDEDLRKSLLKFIADFANWDRSADRHYLEVGRGLVKAAHPDETPLVVDPFAGGGSIPLEALRLGCEAFASDLNPVACLIQKVMLEDIPRHGPELADELRRVGAEIKAEAEKELAEFYPPDPDGSRPIAYLWARTVRCESPNCGAEIPLMRSFWLCKKASRKRALRYKVIRPEGETPYIEFEIFEPKKDKDVSDGTVTRAKATCTCCNTVLSPDRVRAQLREQRGGADVVFDENGTRAGGARLLAVVTLKQNGHGRYYRLPTEADYKVVWKAEKSIEEIAKVKLPSGLSPVPDEPLPPIGTLGFRVQRYGMLQWGDLFTSRQKLSLITLSRTSANIAAKESVKEVLGLALTRAANAGCSLCRWHVSGEKHEGVYSRQALPIVWDFSEGNPLSDATGGYSGAVEWIARVIEEWPNSSIGQVQLSDAAFSPLPEESISVWFTDPPYYDAIPYADLSDFFFVWLKRMLSDHPLLRDPYETSNQLTPKAQEAVQDEIKEVNGSPKNRAFFENKMRASFTDGRRILKDEGLGCVVFAHKTTEGWEALLSGMIQGGWTITGSWPIATEMGARLRSQDSAALATSVHLVCRPRPEDASVGDWGEVLSELPNRVGDWMERLQSEGVRGADLVFACIGPALEIFSRYSKVATAILTDIGKRGLANLVEEDYIAKAISATAQEFRNIEGLDGTLKSLCTSGAFRNLLNELRNGQKDLSGDDIVSVFIKESGFFAGSETEHYALKILATLATKLDQEIYRSEDGIAHLANRIEALHVKAGEKVEQVLVGLVNLSRQQLPLPSDNIDAIPEVKEKMLHAKIDIARDLLQKGKSISARNILQDLRKEAEKQGASNDVYFRIATNLGACALDVADNETAMVEFNRACEYHPDDPKALANCALARIIDNMPQEALELSIRARERTKNDAHSTCIFLQALNLTGRTQEIEDLIAEEPWIGEDKICSLGLGDINLKKGHYEKAEQYLRKAVELDASNAAAYELLGLSIFLPIQKQLQSCPPLLGTLQEYIIQKLNEIDVILTKAIELANDCESRIKLHEMYINRAGVRGILGRCDDALRDCDYVLIEEPANRVALQNKGRIQISKNLYSEVIECFEKAGDSSIQIPLAYAYMESKRFDDAARLLESLRETETETDESRLIMAADLLLQVYHELHNSDKLKELMQVVLSRWPDNAEALAAAAHQYQREGAVEAAIDCMEKALLIAHDIKRDWLHYELANLYFEQREYGKAAKTYSRIANTAVDSSLTQKYLSALYNAGEFREALTIARSFRLANNGQPLPFISEIETYVLEYIGEIGAAKELLGQLSFIEPAKIKHKLRLALMNLRIGNDEDARAILERISINELGDDTEVLIRVAYARAYLRMPDALLFAYRARCLVPDNSEIQSAYLGLFFGPLASNISIKEPDTVGIDTVVNLQRVEVLSGGRTEVHSG